MVTADQPMGLIIREGDRLGLRYERSLRHPVEKVWRAITESEHLRHWLPADIVGERKQGATLELPFRPEMVERYSIAEPVLRGQIQVWEPYSVFEWTWETDVLRFDLQPAPYGTLLVLTTWLSGRDSSKITDSAAGYHVCLDQLVDLLDGGDSGPLVDAEMSDWERRYGEAVSRELAG